MAGVMSACIDANNARDFHASVMAEIEDSNFAPSVISACKAQAENAEYELLIDSNSVVKDEDGKPTLMEVILKYEYHICPGLHSGQCQTGRNVITSYSIHYTKLYESLFLLA